MQESKGQPNSRLPLNYAHDFMDYYVQFARAFSIPKGDLNSPLDRKHLVRALDHVIEEHDETMRAATAYLASGSLENLTEFADGIVDSIYVLCQAAYMFDIPLKEAFLEVHRSNMRKVGADGTIKRRADGKILKPEGWTPPNLWEVLHRYSNCRAMETGSQGAENWKDAGDTEGQGFCGPERKTMTKPDTDRRPVLRGRPKNPESIRHDADVPRLKGCPDCGGRGYYLIQPFRTGGSNGAGGLGNMCHCLTCVDSKAYWDEFGELPPSVVADMDRVSNDQPCDVANEADLWRCTVCGRIGTVGRCCGEETREPVRAASGIEDA